MAGGADPPTNDAINPIGTTTEPLLLLLPSISLLLPLPTPTPVVAAPVVATAADGLWLSAASSVCPKYQHTAEKPARSRPR